MKLALIVHSKYQGMLDKFLASMLPTVDDAVEVYAITENLEAPKRVINIRRSEFHPNRYFQMVADTTAADYLGIVNDDIFVSSDWLKDIRTHLKFRECVSPGFIETTDIGAAEMESVLSGGLTGVHGGFFDAFYVFRKDLVHALGDFDQNIVEWYDIDWYLRLLNAGVKPVVVDRITVQHLKEQTRRSGEYDRASIRREIIAKHGTKGLKEANRNNVAVRNWKRS